MLKYTGKGDYNAVNIRIYGDGVTQEVWVDLTKAPFFFNWGQGNNAFYPKSIDVNDISGSPSPSVSMQGSILSVVFDTPPPATDFSKTTEPHPTPYVSFTVNLIYGMQITKNAHRSDS